MSPKAISYRWLSLRCWLIRTVLPAAICLIATLMLLKLIGPDPVTLDHTATLVGFAALYFILFRGGHMLMIRSLHQDMMRRYEEAYREKLAGFSENELRRGNLGFMLARVKRDILVEELERKKNPFGD